MIPKEILSHLFNAFDLKILDLYLETRLRPPLKLAERVLHRTFMLIFNNFHFFMIIMILSFLLAYLSLLWLLSLPKLVSLSLFLSLSFISFVSLSAV